MNELVKRVLNGRTVKQMLTDEAKEIKRIGESREEMTYAVRKDHGFVTAKINPVPKRRAA